MAKNSILDYDTTPDNNTDMGGIGIQGTSAVNNFDNAFRTLMSQIADWTGSSTIASGTTTDLSSVKGAYVTVSGTSTITSLGTAKAGWTKHVLFTGTPTLTHNGTSLILPSSANIVATSGDTAVFVSEGSGNWRCTEYTSTFAKTMLDDASGAAVFATMGATQSLGNSGYTKLPNGLIIQWARSVAITGGNLAISFPLTFPNAVYSVTASSAHPPVGTNTTYVCWGEGVTLSGFNGRAREVQASGVPVAADLLLSYVAFGR